MEQTYDMGNIAGLNLTVESSALIVAGAMVVGLFLVGITALSLSVVAAILFAILFTLGHYAVAIIHQYGHAIAAKRVDYPMSGIHLYLALGRSMYPADETPLTPRQHIQRALGGPAISLLASIPLGILAIVASSTGGFIFYLLFGWFLDSLVVFTLGAFLPLGFTDGSTILHYLKQTR